MNSEGVEIESWFSVSIILMQGVVAIVGKPSVKTMVTMILGDVLFIMLVVIHILLIVNDKE